MTKETGGPAFPTYHGGYTKCDTDGGGMTLRDYFAAKAMQSFITIEPHMPSLAVAIAAYNVANAMLKAREQ